MPNWCENQVTISGDNLQLEYLMSMVDPLWYPSKEEEEQLLQENPNWFRNCFSFNEIIPMPKELIFSSAPALIAKTKEEEDSFINKGISDYITLEESKRRTALYGTDDWHNWSIINWGCKWNIDQSDLTIISYNEICYYFSTPWSPPEGVLENLSKRFPELEFNIIATDYTLPYRYKMNLQNGYWILEEDITFEVIEEINGIFESEKLVEGNGTSEFSSSVGISPNEFNFSEFIEPLSSSR